MEKVEIKTSPDRMNSLVVGDKIFRSAFDYELSSEDLERARVELNETDEVREESLQILRKMISRDKTIYRTDDAYILRFLRCKKFNCKEAYEMMRVYYSIRRDYPQVYSSLPSVSKLKTFMERKVAINLPYRDEDGSLIFIDRIGKWDPKEHSLYEMFQMFQPIGDIMSMNPCMQIHKIVMILDFENTSMSYLPAVLYPRAVLFWTRVWQNNLPYRLKYVILLNCNKAAYTVLNAVRHLLKKKVAERIIVIGSDITELHQYVNPAILPKEYGGSLEDSQSTTIQHIMDNLHYVEYEISLRNRYRSDNSFTRTLLQ